MIWTNNIKTFTPESGSHISTSLFSGTNKLNKKNRFALDIKARCVAELYQSFQIHNGELYKIKEQMPCIIETILMCYKGYCGYL
jgi:hypothetical protein